MNPLPWGMARARSAAQELITYIERSPTPYHAVRETAKRLEDAGYQRRELRERWQGASLSRGYVQPGDGAIFAWDMSTGSLADGAVVLAAHTDSPALRVKDRGISWRHGYLALPTEIYGGPILSSWVDRELGIAGRAVTREGAVHLVELDTRVTIPGVAIHLNRKVNEGVAINPQDHMVALAAADSCATEGSAREVVLELVAAKAGVEADALSEVELLLFDPEPGHVIGLDGSMFSSSRIDNLGGCATNLNAFLAASSGPARILALYNHEEVGSVSAEGAGSQVLERIVERLVRVSGGDAEDAAVALERSVAVSNDAGHALHPSYTDKYDSDYAPVLGAGPVLKINAMYRYATTAPTGARFAAACERAGVSMQRLAMRSDMRSGSTVGPITWARTGISTVDVGLPLLAMHSLRETAGTADVELMNRALRSFLEEDV